MNIPNQNTNGVHSGSLWKLGDDAHLYLTSLHGTCNPLDNPEFKKAFENAKAIAVPFFCDYSEEQDPIAFIEKELFLPLAGILRNQFSLEGARS